jgi:hypothetical protein
MGVFEIAILIDIQDIGADELFVRVIDLFVDDGDLLSPLLMLFDIWAEVDGSNDLWGFEDEEGGVGFIKDPIVLFDVVDVGVVGRVEDTFLVIEDGVSSGLGVIDPGHHVSHVFKQGTLVIFDKNVDVLDAGIGEIRHRKIHESVPA